ncbi:hypothetical protein DH2020_023241 [Rehmannia glutinosa]|uniref:65-kDa microtubule-associated protein 3 n=1 Tax=Rehmannia glutinosa TaxID=99300 RepID=A0ABR0W7T9_REHGL
MDSVYLFPPLSFWISDALCFGSLLSQQASHNRYIYQGLEMESTCGSLLFELQKIWDEVGEADNERDKMLFELEQECLDAYRRKVDQASRCRAQLRQAVADAEAQLADIYAALGDRPVHMNKSSGSLKKELHAIMPQLEDMKKKRNERKSQFAEVLKQINSISKELSGSTEDNLTTMVIDEHDLSMKRLDDLQSQLLLLQREKGVRLRQVLDQLNVLNALCMVLGMDFKSTVCSVHPTLGDSSGTKSISADTIKSLSATICRLKDVKLQRMQRVHICSSQVFAKQFIQLSYLLHFQLQELAMTMVELWNLMDTPVEEQHMFQSVTRTIAAAENEITEPNSLSLEFIDNAETEVMRLQEMKMSKIKEVISRKREILEEICRGAHMVVDGQFGTDLSVESIESGAISPSDLLEQLEFQISKVKEEAFSRKEILEKVQKWLAAREEESWLEEYNRDDNRYNAGRGTHLMLKRAEKARVIVNKIPGKWLAFQHRNGDYSWKKNLNSNGGRLKSKAKTWEKERKTEFLYDGVGLISMIDEYCELKHLKEQERQKQRDQKKLQGQLMTEQEAIYGSKPSPSKSSNKSFRPSTGGAANKRFSLGGAVLQNTLSDKSSLPSHSLLKNKSNSSNRNLLTAITTMVSSLLILPARKTMVVALLNSIPAMHQTHKNMLNFRRCERPSLPYLLYVPISFLAILRTRMPKLVSSRIHRLLIKLHRQRQRKTVSAYDENRTPKTMPIPLPATPPTMSNAMQTATTPFTPGIRGVEEVEYSYEEERRAGFVSTKLHSRPLSLV